MKTIWAIKVKAIIKIIRPETLIVLNTDFNISPVYGKRTQNLEFDIQRENVLTIIRRRFQISDVDPFAFGRLFENVVQLVIRDSFSRSLLLFPG